MNLGMSASIIRMPFLSKSSLKKFKLNEQASKSLIRRYFLCHSKSQQRTNQLQMENQYCPISFISYSDVSFFWLADISSIVLFPIYLRYHPDGLGGSVKPAHKKLLLPTPQGSKIQSHAHFQSQAPPDIVMHIHWGAFKSFYIFVHIRNCLATSHKQIRHSSWRHRAFWVSR